MTTIEIKEKIFKDNKDKIATVWITTSSFNKFKRKLRIDSLGMLNIGEANNPFPNYKISELQTSKWENVEEVIPRKKKSETSDDSKKSDKPKKPKKSKKSKN